MEPDRLDLADFVVPERQGSPATADQSEVQDLAATAGLVVTRGFVDYRATRDTAVLPEQERADSPGSVAARVTVDLAGQAGTQDSVDYQDTPESAATRATAACPVTPATADLRGTPDTQPQAQEHLVTADTQVRRDRVEASQDLAVTVD